MNSYQLDTFWENRPFRAFSRRKNYPTVDFLTERYCDYSPFLLYNKDMEFM